MKKMYFYNGNWFKSLAEVARFYNLNTKQYGKFLKLHSYGYSIEEILNMIDKNENSNENKQVILIDAQEPKKERIANLKKNEPKKQKESCVLRGPALLAKFNNLIKKYKEQNK